MKPFLKWAGGKNQLLPYIEAYYPFEDKNINKYAEPFIGGGAVLFDILSKYDLDDVYISDVNKSLINTYKSIQQNVGDVIAQLEAYQEKFWPMEQEGRKVLFYKNRDRYNELLSLKFLENINTAPLTDKHIELASLFIFLNRTCFNGLYRVNRNGFYNVPMGEYKRPLICDAENLVEVAKALAKVHIVCDTYKAVDDFADKQTFVYIDPPYRPLSETANFTSYSEYEFNDDSQRELAEFAHHLDGKGVRVLLSNSDPKNTNPDDEFFDEIYSGFKIERIFANRAINSKGSKRGKITELLISN